MGRKTLLTSVACSLVIIAGLTALLFLYPKNKPIQSPYPNDVKMWNHIFSSKGDWQVEQTKGAILPHHIIVADYINNFYKSLAKVASPKLFVIIGPNHYQNGAEDVQTCFDCVYKTTEGEVNIDKKMASLLVNNRVAERDDKTFQNEHAIFSHTPFIKHYFPNAKILPIVFQWKTPKEKVDKVIDSLIKNLGNRDNIFFIASVDFSHYVTKNIADIHDESSFATISNFDFNNIYDLEIDSPSSIYAIEKLMKNFGYQKVDRLAHTNTQDFLPTPIARTTSHQFITFSKGPQNKIEKTITALFLNGPFKNLGIGILDSWNWMPETPLKYPEVNSIRGEEDRFLTGFDYIIFDLPKNECKSYLQNGLKINFCNNAKKSGDVFFNINDFTKNITGVLYKSRKYSLLDLNR